MTDNKNIRNKLFSLLSCGEFEEAEKLFDDHDKNDQKELITCLSCDEESMVIYAFISYLISKKNDAFLHELAVISLVSMCSLEGAYQTALYHARMLCRLDPDIENTAYLLFLHDIPEKLVSDEEALDIARKILNSSDDKELRKAAERVIERSR